VVDYQQNIYHGDTEDTEDAQGKAFICFSDRLFRVASSINRTPLIPGLPKLNPGLELANAFSVKGGSLSALRGECMMV
jgi:hypothetical protein